MKGQRLAVAMLTLGALVVAWPAQAAANVWGEYAIISNTINDGRFCMGHSNREMACPTYAPSLTTAGDVSVTGNLSATKFIGDGSLLTGLSGGDRVVSGTSNIIVNQNGAISFTTAGTQRMFVDSSGNVGMGTTVPAYIAVKYLSSVSFSPDRVGRG